MFYQSIQKNQYPFIISVLFFTIVFVFSETYLYTALGLALGLFFILKVIVSLGESLPIKDLILSIVSIQWVFGAKLSYYFDNHSRYKMYTDEPTYMSIVVPAIIFFALGLFSIKHDFSLKLAERDSFKHFTSNKKQAIFGVFIFGFAVHSYLAFFLVESGGTFSFILYLLSLLMNVGVCYLVFFHKALRLWVIFGYLLILLIFFLRTGMLSNMVVPIIFPFFFIFPFKISLYKKIIIISIGAILVFMIQTVKSDYRKIVDNYSSSTDLITELYELIESEFTVSEGNDDYSVNSEENLDEVNNRFNQGWIISRVFYNVPRNVPFQDGRTVKDAIKFTLMPRIIFLNKPTSKNQIKDFEKITGIRLVKGTSMGLSVIGEFYANYGKEGSFIAIFIYGFAVSIFITILINICGSSFSALFWIPLLLMQAIKAESNLASPLNYMVKALILLFVIKLIFKTFKINLLESNRS